MARTWQGRTIVRVEVLRFVIQQASFAQYPHRLGLDLFRRNARQHYKLQDSRKLKPEISIDPLYLVYFAAIEQARRETGGDLASLDNEMQNRDLLQIVSTLETWAWAGSSDLQTTQGGYLKGRHGDLNIFVPFHLVEHFPFLETAEELADFADAIRLSDRGYICVSGSAAVLRSVGVIGDIDFCEYLTSVSHVELESLKRQTMSEESIVLVRIKWSNIASDVRPWEKDIVGEFHAAVQKNEELSTASWKTDSLALSSTMGPISVTNVVLPQGKPVHSLAFDERSWVYQEAILTNDTNLIVDLAKPRPFGSYLLWLRQQIEVCLKDKPLKAAKRALSLCLILSFSDEEALLALGLQAPILVKAARADAVTEARRFAAMSRDELPASLREAIEATTGTIAPEAQQTSDALQFCREAAALAAQRFDTLFEEALLIVAEELYG